MKSTKCWVCLLTVAVLLSIGAIILTRALTPRGQFARVFVDGTCIREIDLHGEGLPLSFTVMGADGGSNTIQVEEGRIRVSEADCPDQICVRQGWISDGTVPIVCLPHRLTIQIDTGGDDAFDAAVG